ncbi:MAG: extensin family protein, partial [Gemmobacter sp.]|nr:extensin family protein [Gemmobacter sp.]
QAISPIVGKVKGCGVANPVRVTSVDGVALSQAATIDCQTAEALTDWVQRALKPEVGRTGGGVAKIHVAAHYACRGRNNRSGARLSEHAKGKAIDISAITLANGQTLSVLKDWRGKYGSLMKAVHKRACGIFGTTLGPGSDGMHEDHFHYDTAQHRNGSYCR